MLIHVHSIPFFRNNYRISRSGPINTIQYTYLTAINIWFSGHSDTPSVREQTRARSVLAITVLANCAQSDARKQYLGNDCAHHQLTSETAIVPYGYFLLYPSYRDIISKWHSMLYPSHKYPSSLDSNTLLCWPNWAFVLLAVKLLGPNIWCPYVHH